MGVSVVPCRLSDIAEFVERNHYSKSTRGLAPDICFKVVHERQIISAAIFGRSAMNSTVTKYSENGRLKLTELRKFVMVDDTPRNTESFVLGKMFKELRKLGFERILSYADPEQGHVGTVYRATGFRLIGQSAPSRVAIHQNRRVSNRSIERHRDDYSCVLGDAAKNLRQALETGEAEMRHEAGKFIYILDLNPPNPQRRPLRLSIRVNLLHGRVASFDKGINSVVSYRSHRE